MLTANPFSYLFSIAAIAAVALFFGWAAFNRMGLKSQVATATITGKQINPAGKTYISNYAGGRNWVQAHETPETYVLSIKLMDIETVMLTDPQHYQQLTIGDTISVRYRKTRLTKRIEVIGLMPQ